LSQSRTHKTSLSAFISGKNTLPAALPSPVRRIAWIRGYERIHGIDVLVEGLWVGWAADPRAIAPEKAAACCHACVDMVRGRGPCQIGDTAAG
jgi:hypothetical protein